MNGRRISLAGASADAHHDASARTTPRRTSTSSADLRILLCHYPRHAPAAARRAGRTSCSPGHLHGGQICVPWPGGRVGLAHPRSGPITALEACNGTVMHVSPGLGTTFVPFRLFAQPEVTLLRLRPA